MHAGKNDWLTIPTKKTAVRHKADESETDQTTSVQGPHPMPNGADGPRNRGRGTGHRREAPRGGRPSGSLEGSYDMDSLRAAVSEATAGTGQIRAAITTCTFQPREAAFTSLIQQCSRMKQWQKALEVFDVLSSTRGLSPNTICYSAVISACSNAARWQEAELVFQRMLDAAKSDPACQPNTITYSSLISACERGGRLDRALTWFQKMKTAGVEADQITFSALITACERNGEMDTALRLLEGAQQAGHPATSETYARLIEHCGRRHNCELALELFLGLQMAGGEVSRPVVLAMLAALEASSRARQAAQLLEAYQDTGVVLDAALIGAGLRVYAKVGSWRRAVALWDERCRMPGSKPDTVHAQLVIDACLRGDNRAKAAELQEMFRREGILTGLSPESVGR